MDSSDIFPDEAETELNIPFCSKEWVRYVAYIAEVLLGFYFVIMVVHLYRYFQMNEYFGPLVVAVRKMINDVIRFFALIVFAMYAYSIFQDVLLYPGHTEKGTNWITWMFHKILGKGLFHIFGELYDDEIQLTVYSGFEWGCVSPLDPEAYKSESDYYEKGTDFEQKKIFRPVGLNRGGILQ